MTDRERIWIEWAEGKADDPEGWEYQMHHGCKVGDVVCGYVEPCRPYFSPTKAERKATRIKCKRIDRFLAALTRLTQKHGIVVCGFDDGPWLRVHDRKGIEGFYGRTDDDVFEWFDRGDKDDRQS